MLNKILCAGSFQCAIRNFEKEILCYLFSSCQDLFVASRHFQKRQILRRQDLSPSFLHVYLSGPLSVDLVKVESYSKVASDNIISRTYRDFTSQRFVLIIDLILERYALAIFICDIPKARLHEWILIDRSIGRIIMLFF